MKSKLAIAVALSGWLLLFVFIFYEFEYHGSDILKHLIHIENPAESIFHIIILTVPIGSTITAYLINERKKLLIKTQQSEKKLRHAAEEWRATFDAMPYGVMLVDTEFNIIRANKYISKLSGIPIRELIFRKCYEVIHRQNKPIENCPVVKSVSTRNTEKFEYYDAEYNKYFMTSATPIFDDKGNVIAYSHSLIDITDIKQKEDKLIQSKDAFFNMLKDTDTAHKEVKELYNDLIVAFANTIDAKSPWTKGHSERVTHYAVSIAREMGLNEKEIETLKTAGLVHDIGKIGTYDIILDKPDRLTKEEFELVKMHPAQGEKILSPIKGLKSIIIVIRSHHEKLDGTGYPDGLKGEDIPLLSKILCAADSYDSMTADRPYRPSPGKEYAISEFKRCSGTQFDPQVVEAFLRVLEK
ncbi:MAG: HD domain-containing protein [Thermodesulfovibrionia bacterium]|nr:HD domain-containing protein [Thermodesulfovibrionia bacterium]